MLPMIGMGIAGALGLFGHVKTKEFISRRLRYTPIAEKSATGMGLAAGAATTVTAVVLPLPLITVAPALLLGAGIGSGVALGIRKARGDSSSG